MEEFKINKCFCLALSEGFTYIPRTAPQPIQTVKKDKEKKTSQKLWVDSVLPIDQVYIF